MTPEPTLAALLARLDRVEAHQAVADLMSSYINACDLAKDIDRIVEHFTPDAVWEGVGRNIEFGTWQGREAIAANFRGVQERQPFTYHYLTNQEIRVADDALSATGRWLCFEPSTIREGTLPVWIGLAYDNTFVRDGEQWFISHLAVDTLFATPYGKGWGVEMFTPVTAPKEPSHA